MERSGKSVSLRATGALEAIFLIESTSGEPMSRARINQITSQSSIRVTAPFVRTPSAIQSSPMILLTVMMMILFWVRWIRKFPRSNFAATVSATLFVSLDSRQEPVAESSGEKQLRDKGAASGSPRRHVPLMLNTKADGNRARRERNSHSRGASSSQNDGCACRAVPACGSEFIRG